MKQPLFKGSAVALVTPFKDGKINYEVMKRLIDMQIEGGTAAIVVCGTTGESATQTLEEHMEAVEFCASYAAGRICVIAGAGSNDTAAAVMLSRHGERCGADGLLVVTPYYNKATQRGLIRHYNAIADAVNVPIILYNVPSRTGCGFTAETYRELSKHPNIIGVKEASGNFSLINETKAICDEDFYIWSGDDALTLPMMAMGAQGVISVLANILPGVMTDICRLCFENDFAAARELNYKYLHLMNAMFCEVNPIPVKTAMNLLGYEVGELRLPLCEMEEKNVALLRRELEAVGLQVR